MTIINRVWAMPNSQTFTIKPIKELIERHIADKEIIIDPFARDSKYGTITNDLNPEYDTICTVEFKKDWTNPENESQYDMWG